VNDTATLNLNRRRPRAFLEWLTLRRWGKLPNREANVPGYLLREIREKAGFTQAELARKLGITQQAVARAERWSSNPTVGFIHRWAAACGQRFQICFVD
jgi:DNA-binding XRE family transcriptional regulator